MGIHQLDSHRFAAFPQWIGSLLVAVDEIAARNGMRLESWEEDGLGPARGFLCQLPSGRVILARALTYQAAACPGAELLADLTEIARTGVESVLAEAVASLGVAPQEVDPVGPPLSQAEAADMLSRLRERDHGP